MPKPKKSKKSKGTKVAGKPFKVTSANPPVLAAANRLPRFVIMLDDYVELYPDQWPISAAGESIAQLRLVSQHSGRFVLQPRTAFDAVLKESKSLMDSRNGRIDSGGIYEVR